ncbi:uncharacterized protein LOC119671792 [Teleopsis dalmanni]|uniref:uncharacterized protein LOC119671783 n=1 Tax=Teleopsis dalmanni TaxID=139649 RepID=UPI0018CF0FCD|nr:uncharacterized protein LOC119671783 [Teleopsis dalmanni]XP_037938504.1 uncharacterized protein LOC119671792 [Teleopsis dalmanni]
MKFALAILAVCLLTVNGAVVNYEGLVNDMINDAKNSAVQTGVALEHQYENIVVDPLHQVEEAVDSIESRREESDTCVAAENEVVEAVVNTMHDEMNVCGIVAAKTSAEIMIDVNAATQQIIFDGIDVARTYQKCRNYKNPVLKNSCYVKLSVKGGLYMKNARKSMKVINDSKNVRVPAVFTDADSCTHVASDKAVEDLNNVHTSIDSCIVKMTA